MFVKSLNTSLNVSSEKQQAAKLFTILTNYVTHLSAGIFQLYMSTVVRTVDRMLLTVGRMDRDWPGTNRGSDSIDCDQSGTNRGSDGP